MTKPTQTKPFDYLAYLDTPQRLVAYIKEQEAEIERLRAALEEIAAGAMTEVHINRARTEDKVKLNYPPQNSGVEMTVEDLAQIARAALKDKP